MKPIEIHIEGYKIVIEEDKKPEVTKDEEKITYIPYPVTPTYPDSTSPQNPDWWRYPYVTWTGGEVSTTNTTKPDFHPVYDTMIGKTAMADGGIVNIKLTSEQIANAPKNDPVGEKGVPGC